MLITKVPSEHSLIYNFKVKKYVGPQDLDEMVNQNERMSRNLNMFIFFKALSILV